MKKQLISLLFIAGFALAAKPAQADMSMTLGARGGFTFTPDVLFAGGHLAIDGIGVPSLRIEPFASVGFPIQDGISFALRLGGHAKYLIPLPDTKFVAFPLAGLSVYHLSIDVAGISGSDTSIGFDIGGGIQYENFGGQLQLGLGDIPDFTIVGFYNF